MAIGVAFGLMGAFFMAGMYVAGALGCLSLIMLFFFGKPALWNIMSSKAFDVNTGFILVAIPLFLLMGELINRSGIGERMYTVISRWVWFLPGGLVHTNIVSSALFAACSGSSVATSATISRVSLPSLRHRGYSERMVIGSLAAGGTLGILIPPSITLILYGVLVEESVGRLFMAGFIPGLLLSASFMVMIAIVALVWRRMAPREQGYSLGSLYGWRIRVLSLFQLLPILALVFLVLGAIYLGLASPGEAAAFGVTGAFILAILFNSADIFLPFARHLLKTFGLGSLFPPESSEHLPLDRATLTAAMESNFRMVRDSLLSAVRTTGMIFLILLAALTLSFAFARLGISQQIAEVISDLQLNDWQLVLALVLFYLVLGTFMESFAMMVTTVPILLPALNAADVDLIWFGVIMVILVEAALISPPEGINLYVLHGVRRDIDREQAQSTGQPVPESTIKDVWIGVLPFMACMAIVAGLVLAFPQLALWLPNLIYGAR